MGCAPSQHHGGGNTDQGSVGHGDSTTPGQGIDTRHRSEPERANVTPERVESQNPRIPPSPGLALLGQPSAYHSGYAQPASAGGHSTATAATTMAQPPPPSGTPSAGASLFAISSTMVPSGTPSNVAGGSSTNEAYGSSSNNEQVLFSVLPPAPGDSTYNFRQSLQEALREPNVGVNGGDTTSVRSLGESVFSLESAAESEQLLTQCEQELEGRFVHPYEEVERSLKEGHERRRMMSGSRSQALSTSAFSSGRGNDEEPELHYGPNGLLAGQSAPPKDQQPPPGLPKTLLPTLPKVSPQGGRQQQQLENTTDPVHIESLSTLCPRPLDEATLWKRNLKGGVRHPVFRIKLQTPKERQKLRSKEISRCKVTGRALLPNHPGAGNEPLPFQCFEASSPGTLFADIALRTAHSLYHYVELQQWRKAAEEAKAGYTLAGIQLTNFYALFRHCHIKLCDLILVENNPKIFLHLLRGSGLMTVYIPSTLDPQGHPVPSICGSQSQSMSQSASLGSLGGDGMPIRGSASPAPMMTVSSSSRDSLLGSGHAAVVQAEGINPPARLAPSTDYFAVNSHDLMKMATRDLVEEVIYTIKTIETLLLAHQQSMLEALTYEI